MAHTVTYHHEPTHVMVTVEGAPTLDEFLGVLQQVGADSVHWRASSVLVDLRGVATPYSFTDQLRIGEAVGRNFGHLAKAAAVAPAERITRVGEKAARHHGARAQVFATVSEAVAWITA